MSSNFGQNASKGTVADEMAQFEELLIRGHPNIKPDVEKFIGRMNSVVKHRKDSQRVVELAVKSEACWELLKVGGDKLKARRNGRSHYPICQILRQYPSASKSLLEILDTRIEDNIHLAAIENVQIEKSGENPVTSVITPESADLCLTLKFTDLLPSHSSESGEEMKQPEMGFVNEIALTPGLGEKRTDAILKHPLIQAFIELKWEKFTKFAFLSLVFYVMLSILMTVYVLNIQLTNCRVKLNLTAMGTEKYTTRNTENNRKFRHMFSLLINPPELEKHNKYATGCQELATFHFIFIPVMFTMTLVILILEILEIRTEGRRYWKNWTNYLQWIYVIFGAFTMFPVNMVPSRMVLYAQYQFSGFGILLIWVLLLVQASKFKLLARYVDMLWELIRTLSVFFLAFGCLFIGFTLAGLVLFSNLAPMETVPRSLLKTLVAMNGEFNYEDNFYRDIREVKGENGTELRNKHILLYPASSHIFLGIFTFVCPMALMNLLIALAVQDVQVMFSKVEGIMLRRITHEIYHTEKVLHKLSWLMNFFKMTSVSKWLMAQLALDLQEDDEDTQIPKLTFKIYPNRDAERRLPPHMLQSLRSFVEQKHNYR